MTRVLAPVHRLRRDFRRNPGALPWGIAFGIVWCAVGIATVKAPFLARAVLGIAIVAVYFIIAMNSRIMALGIIVAWLTFLGFTRRLLIPFIGYPEFDPLLVLGPACAVALWITSRGTRIGRTATSTMVVLLFGMALAQVFNPSAENLAAGPLSALFWLGPLLWFIVGRRLKESDIDGLFRLVHVLMVPVILLGLYHSFGFFLPFELTWVGLGGIGEFMFLDGFRIRPFSTLNSPQEYGFFLSFGLIVIWARLLTDPEHRARRAALFAVGVFALFLQGGRQTFSFFALAIVATVVMRARMPGLRLVMTGMVVVVALLGASYATRSGQTIKQPAAQSSNVGALANHTIQGLTNPSASTLPVHIELIAEGFKAAWEQPLGHGIGGTSIAAKKQEGTEAISTENDVSIVFVALGFPGGVLWIVFMIAMFRAGFRRVRRLNPVTLGAAGVLFAFITQWYAGQMYAASTIFWLVLGWLGRPTNEDGSDLEEDADVVLP